MSVPDWFGPHDPVITEAMIDAGGMVLREKQQGHKRLNAWLLVPKSQKQKWLDLAEAVLRAGLRERQ